MTWRTSGESLFRHIRDDVLPAIPSTADAWTSLHGVFSAVGGSEHFPRFFRGALGILAVRRLISYWEQQRPFPANESTWTRTIAQFVKREVFPELDTDNIYKIARMVIPAAKAAGQNINNTTRDHFTSNRRHRRCYLCNLALDPGAPRGDPSRLTIEHVWPRSAGGESVEQNLLPCCEACQQLKGDLFGWEWHNIHNVVLRAEPSTEVLENLRWGIRFARYSYAAMELSDEHGTALKEAFIQNGPLGTLEYAHTGLPITFFDLVLPT
jgi:hypothetical protein